MKTREEAIEAWNTWAGRYKDIDADDFCSVNPCNYCGKVIDSTGNYLPPPIQEMVGFTQMHLNGAIIVPWPKLDKLQSNISNTLLGTDGITQTFSLRSRWCALFRDVTDYREKIRTLITNNDRENKLLNNTLHEWNNYLTAHGFAPFLENDLRGINLSGLRFGGKKYGGCHLRKVDLSFSELTASDLTGANLYGAKFVGACAFSTSFNYSICERTDFTYSNIPRSKFNGCILNFTNFDYCNCSGSTFNGSELVNSSFKSTHAQNSTFCELEEIEAGITSRKRTNLANLQFDQNTVFTDCNFDRHSLQTNKDIQKYLEKSTVQGSLLSRLIESAEVKPGFFGLRVDLKKLFRK
ncbi:pentapeptide repeat-containing protein [Desulfovibrio sp. TomC]|uniref:pentapeptide repeat-containing protein n=1 Tax=Desulfovibrio sp. TomC TaxID=1562888 RepID=UPI0009E1CC11|nr:pentapeptide repeat-containing protein [Desulfovibrio sp. TomC]